MSLGEQMGGSASVTNSVEGAVAFRRFGVPAGQADEVDLPVGRVHSEPLYACIELERKRDHGALGNAFYLFLHVIVDPPLAEAHVHEFAVQRPEALISHDEPAGG